MGDSVKMLGFFIGVVTGIVQFLLLTKFTGAVTKGKMTGKTVIFAVTQFLFPFAVMVLCAFFIVDSLMFIAIGIASAMICGAVARYIITSRSKDR